MASDVEKAEYTVEGSQPNNTQQSSTQVQDAGPPASKGRKLRKLLWDSLDKSPEERAFVNKVDWFIMSYACVAYFVKYLDQQNVRRAMLARGQSR